jgi:diketogulonate reductase-like aldo/keto reductase
MALPEYAWLRDQIETDEGRARIVKTRALEGLARELGLPLAQLAVAWCLKNPDVSSVILGASSPDQLRETLGSLDAVARRRDGADRRGAGQPPGAAGALLTTSRPAPSPSTRPSPRRSTRYRR